MRLTLDGAATAVGVELTTVASASLAVPLVVGNTALLDFATVEVRATARGADVPVEVVADNLANRRPTAETVGDYWVDPAVQGLAYNRGFMYFTTLAELLSAQGGHATLDDLVRSMNARRAEHGRLTLDDWREVLGEAGGASGLDLLDRMLAGELLVPSSDAFGPRFRRITGTFERRDLGFDDMSLTPLPGTVRALRAGSAAQLAGLREGDEIIAVEGVTPSPLHSSRAQLLDAEVALTLRRDGAEHVVRYATFVDEVAESLWVPVA